MRSAATAAAAVVVLSIAAALGATAPDALTGTALDLRVLEERLLEDTRDPLSAFQLSLGADRGQLEKALPVRAAGRFKAGPDTYDHMALRVNAKNQPAPTSGLAIIDGDFFFLARGPMVEATLAVHALDGAEQAIVTLERALGKPEYEVVLPGALDLVVGWRAPGGYLIATFGEGAVFHLSAFPELPNDLVAGSQIVLYEGFADYARKLESGTPVQAIAGELLDVVRWVTTAREKLQPVR